jgi:hypothetical protein
VLRSSLGRTVNDLFAFVSHLLNVDAFRLSVEYHPQLGYPTVIAWDQDERVADDEGRYTTSDLVPQR